MSAPPLVLASTSPQRRAILEQLGIPFDAVAPDYEEPPGGDPRRARRRQGALGRRRRAARARRRHVVVCAGELIGKPRDAADAERMLEALVGPDARGRLRPLPADAARGRSWARETTRVTFRASDPRELAHYLASGEWEGRAGAYAIQGLGAGLVERIEGDYLNVVGLPAALLVRLLAERFPGAYGFG